jgi:hypothetical protein
MTASTVVSDEVALSVLLKAAARQRRYMQPWLGDRRFRAAGGTVLYAVDTDVVKLYTAPDQVAVATERRAEGYAQVFPDDEPSRSEALGYGLAAHIFYRLAGKEPLLVLPPMEQEIRRVFKGVSHDAKIEQDKADAELVRLREVVSALELEKDPQALLERLDHEAPVLARVCSGRKGPSAELRRFGRLLRDARIVPLAFALEQHWIEEPAWRQALAPAERFADRVRLHDLREAWFDRLVSSKSEAASKVLIYDDAQVLARLEWVNARVDRRQGRLVLVTGDSSIHEAAVSFKPEGEEHTFADLYLRHPRAYLAEPGVLSPESPDPSDSEKTELLDWLDTILARFQTENLSYRVGLDEVIRLEDRALERMVGPLLGSQPDFAAAIRARWERYTRNLVPTHLLEAPADEEENEEGFGDLRGSLKELLAKVGDQLQRRKQETWEACFVAAVPVGYGLLFHQTVEQKTPSHNPPLLTYDSFGRASDFVQRMLASRAGRTWDESYRRDLDALLEEDPSRYTYYLAHAVLFAAQGVWHVADILADRALDIADKERPWHISGREAAYLRAVVLRHSARRVTELAKVGPLLDEAQRRLALDREGRPELEAGEIRFDAERLALYLGAHFFHLFLDQPPLDGVLQLRHVQPLLEDMLREITTSKAKRPIVRNVERNLLANLFMAALLRWKRLGEAVEVGAMRPTFDRLQANLESTEEPAIEVTYPVRALYLAAGWWTADEPKKRKRWRRELIDHLSDSAIRDHSVFPYDGSRFRFLRELVA